MFVIELTIMIIIHRQVYRINGKIHSHKLVLKIICVKIEIPEAVFLFPKPACIQSKNNNENILGEEKKWNLCVHLSFYSILILSIYG